MRIVLLGAPGSGKGHAITTGGQDLLRTANFDRDLCGRVPKSTELGLRARPPDSGKLVDDATVLGMIRDGCGCRTPQGFILERIPRNIAQLKPW